MDILESIMAERRRDVEAARSRTSVDSLRAAAAQRVPHSLVAALRQRTGTRIVAELKKASPSAGLLCPDYRPGEVAAGYEKAGAIGISVLTEPHRFLGSEAHLRDVRRASSLPVLRKDFMCDPCQVVEAAAWGADVILLIVAALDQRELRGLYREALDNGLDVLAEAHTKEELERALELDQAIIGVNSRNLKTLKTDLAVARDLAALIPDDRLAIAESGIHSRSDIEGLEQVGYDAFLVGETLMRNNDPAARLKELLGGS